MGSTPGGPKQRRTTILLAALTILLITTAAHAISLYDVVQLSKAGYSDRAIIDLIRKTNSRFYVDSDTIVTLKNEGVREPVIRAILEARTDEKPADERVSSGDASAPADDHRDASTEENRRQAERSETWRNPREVSRSREETGHGHDEQRETMTSMREAFSAFPFEEGSATGHRHASEHVHYAVALEGVPLLIVRSEAGHPSVATRANEIAGALNRAVLGGEGSFVTSSSSAGAGVWFRPSSGASPILVLPVSRGDVIAWQRRSLGAVSAQRLASYWAALLNDFTRVFIHRQPPTAIADLHLGDSLQSIYREMTSSEEHSRGNQSIPRIVDHLTTEEKDHLLELATRVPAEFDAQRRTP